MASVQLSERYISDRFLPDKAIDLIDEAAARLRLQIDSVPEDLEDVERAIRQLEIEREAIKRENDTKKVEELTKDVGEYAAFYNGVRPYERLGDKTPMQIEAEYWQQQENKKRELNTDIIDNVSSRHCPVSG